MKKEKTKQSASVYLDKDLYQWAMDYRTKRNQSFSGIIITLLRNEQRKDARRKEYPL